MFCSLDFDICATETAPSEKGRKRNSTIIGIPTQTLSSDTKI